MNSLAHNQQATETPTQLLLFPDSDPDQTIQARFDAFHRLNPWVADSLIELARQYRRLGHKKIGVKHLVEIVRWDYARAMRGDYFKLNNNMTSRYVRLIAQMQSDVAGVFETRRLRA